eukprot:CAMPEP_0179251296 /NCGR_PEP_ID=MMETSP0797-20121207/21613_1 /TAXON_ID=47934 /ORGANISM="Dinophysis acuminata, Strain DAEP01" /LENGTH=61 /DNA_ID=CAMNT_0020959065 /DNA_START=82 /DNA_END=263 /DNA_ORIENTATION=+
MVPAALVFMLAVAATGLRDDTATLDEPGLADESASAGIERMSAQVAAGKKWTFFFKEWCPS